jgi:hypothetical protein
VKTTEIEVDWVMAMAKVFDDGYPSLKQCHKPNAVEVELTEIESLTAGMTGLCRQFESAYSGRVPRYPGRAGDMVRNHVMGAIAEAAFAKWADCWFGGTVCTFHVADVAGVEVRWNGKGDGVRVRSNDTNINVVGLTGEPPNLKILGWVWSEDAKEDDWWTPYCRCYTVPLERLNAMSTWRSDEARK